MCVCVCVLYLNKFVTLWCYEKFLEICISSIVRYSYMIY